MQLISRNKLILNRKLFNYFTPVNAKSKIDKISKITNWVKLKDKQQQSKALLNGFSINGHTRVLSIE